MTMTKDLSEIDNQSTRKQRYIIRRIIVRGTLNLDTPTCLGSGDAESPTDLALLRDSISDHALLTGSSIAGALRNYLREREHGYMTSERADDLATILFGGMQSDDDGNQSSLIIDDAVSTKLIQSELRDGVKINSITRTATNKAKYDLELLQAGTEFPLSFELLIDRESDETLLLKGLAITLSGLEQGEISLGMKKRRGFGRCHVKKWQVWYFNLEDASDRMAWLLFDRECTNKLPFITNKIADTLGVVLDEKEDKRDRFTIQATFQLASPLLICSGQATPGRAPDVVHLKSDRIIDEIKYFLASCLRQWMFSKAIVWLNLLPQEITLWTSENLELFLLAYLLVKPSKSKLPVLSGTSLAGVLRHRAERIVNTLHEVNSQITQEIVNDIFGFVKDKKELSQSESKEKEKQTDAKASRLVVHESIINDTTDLVQTRIAIDRFTGGVYHGALFQEQPIFGRGDENLKLEIELRNPEAHEIGLLLLLLKDLWIQDLPVGASSSVGRGRLQGKEATLIWKKEQKSCKISQPNLKKNSLEITDNEHKYLEDYVEKLVKYTKQEENKNE